MFARARMVNSGSNDLHETANTKEITYDKRHFSHLVQHFKGFHEIEKKRRFRKDNSRFQKNLGGVYDATCIRYDALR